MTKRPVERTPLAVEVIVVQRALPLMDPQVTQPSSRVAGVADPSPEQAAEPQALDVVHVGCQFQSIEAVEVGDEDEELPAQNPGPSSGEPHTVPLVGVLVGVLTLLTVLVLGGTGVIHMSESVLSEAGVGVCILALFIGTHAAHLWLHRR